MTSPLQVLDLGLEYQLHGWKAVHVPQGTWASSVNDVPWATGGKPPVSVPIVHVCHVSAMDIVRPATPNRVSTVSGMLKGASGIVVKRRSNMGMNVSRGSWRTEVFIYTTTVAFEAL